MRLGRCAGRTAAIFELLDKYELSYPAIQMLRQVARTTNPESSKLHLIERGGFPPLTSQNNTERAPGSVFEPGSSGCFLSSLASTEAIQPAPIAVQPSISTFHCSVLDHLSKALYFALRILALSPDRRFRPRRTGPSSILALLSPLSDLLPLFFSALTTVL